MRLQIVTRGSQREGMGHLIRTRTFAKAAQEEHAVEVIAVAPEELRSVLAELVCPLHLVPDDAGVLTHVEKFGPDVVVFDLTHIDEEVFLAVRQVPLLTASLSPVFEHMPLVDVLFTRAARTPPVPGVRLFAGLQYAVFSELCAPIDDATYERALARPDLPIAVCMGGADAANKTLTVVQALSGLECRSAIWVLLGEGYSHSYNALVDAVRGDRRHEVILAKTNRSMWQVMGNCALAVLAGGLTTIEAVFAGLPSINLFEKPEHWEIMQELFDAGMCLNGGLFSEQSLWRVTDTLRTLNSDRRRLIELRQRMAGALDNQGSQRVLRELEQQLLDKALGQARRAAMPRVNASYP
ncbi:MAG: hypothetical protein AMXMBFR13_19070 [Phycisphaerae bacterium]